MDFQVNGETYFLSLAEDERRWLVFVSTDTGGGQSGLRGRARVQEFRSRSRDKKRRIPN